MFKNVATKIALFAFDTTTGAAKTGDAANITAYVSKDYGSVTVLADTSATEMDATNAKGWYLFDVAQGETNADALLFTAKSTTANIAIVGQYIFTTPNRFTGLVIDSAGLADANAVKVGPSGSGTAQTAADLGAVAPAIKAKTDNLPSDPASESLLIAAIAAVDTDVLTRLPTSSYTAPNNSGITAIKAQTDKLAFTVANQVDANIQYVNDVQVNGVGTTGSPWGP
jgi:hypothetical protein